MGFETNKPIEPSADPMIREHSSRYFRDALEQSEADGPPGLDSSDLGYLVAAIQLVGAAICEALDERSSQEGYQPKYDREEVAKAAAAILSEMDAEIARRKLGPAFGQVAGE